MSSDQLALLIGAGVLAIGAVCVGLTVAWYAGRRYADASPRGERPAQAAQDRPEPDAPTTPDDELTAPRPQVRARAIRIVALVYLAAVAGLVAISGWWQAGDASETAGAIYLLVAAGTLAVVFLQDLVPGSLPDGLRGWLEAGAAIGFLTVLVGLSNGLTSPFLVGFFLLVGAASLSRDGWAPLVIAVVSGLCYGAIGLLVAYGQPVDAGSVGLIVFVTTTLVLLAYVCTVAGREQRRSRDAALRLAQFDPLTSLYNRAHFFASMERELRLAQRAGRSFGVLMLDLDGLKPVNDTFGHHYGDRLLQAVTEVIQRTVRATDTPARYGGDEFVILLPDTDAAGAYVVAEKLRRDIAGLSIRVSDRTVRTSVSIGLVAYPDDGSTAEELMAAADTALYEAKRSGKDRIVGYTTRTERVATRMGTPGAPSTPGATGGSSPGVPPAQGVTGGSSPATIVRPAQAPWQTDATRQGPGTGRVTGPGVAAAPARPAGTDQPPVPRRLVTLKVDGEPTEAPASSDTTTGDTTTGDTTTSDTMGDDAVTGGRGGRSGGPV